YMAVSALEGMGELIKAVPSVEELEEERFDAEFVVNVATQSSDAEIHEKLSDVSEVASVELFELRVGPLMAQVADPAATEEGWQTRKVSDTPAETASSHGVREGKSDAAADAPGSVGAGPAVSRSAPTVRVSTERLDSLVNLVGELVIDRTRLQQIALQYQLEEVEEVIRHVGSVITDTQTLVMKLRMVPVERVFSRFPRMVRDLARELGKDVELVVEGQETELDRLMIDEIADPLLHLLRNAVDHGLEGPDEREQAGKPRAGTIFLRARHEGNHVIIEVEDDGKGMNPEFIKRRAIEKGVVTAEEAGRLSDKQALELIFAAGFSTRDQATDISGRGVGMDVVKNKTVALGGTLDMTSTVGKGTLVTIHLPLTLAIIECMLTEVGEEIYAIPISFIEDAHDWEDMTIQTVQEEEIALLRGHSMPLLRLRVALGSPSEESTESAVVVVRTGSRRTGLVVDRLMGQQEVVIKPISKLVGQL
ncbi:MAG: chemotaxis protein CheA, partial [Cyanobacteria bacterium REEB65]|nr:chemotaxis protein CheA [Cyanobacteria bacterium REEB65]